MEQKIKPIQEITGYKARNTVCDNILIPFKNELDYYKGGSVIYPEMSGQRYLVDRFAFEKWWRKNAKRVRERKRK